VELLAERGVQVDASTVFDGVQHFTLLSKEAARPYRRRVGSRWAVDETSIRMAGRFGLRLPRHRRAQRGDRRVPE